MVYKVIFDTEYQPQYEALLNTGKVTTIPIEYYTTSWKSFARQPITAQSIPFKPVLIDSSARRYQNGSDVYISRIINDELDDDEKVELAQAYRKMKEAFIQDSSVRKINEKIRKKSDVSGKSIEVSVDLATQRSWETVLMTYFDKIPFHQIGQGEQCVVKTVLALGHRKAEEANLIIMEEPENHLTHTKMNELLKHVQDRCEPRQVLVSTHSSFVANKLGLEHLILLRDGVSATLSDLDSATQKFFKRLAGYQTLRLLLCKKAILVEGDSDELIVQKAYMTKHDGRLPIEDGIDVISVGLTFDRFLKIAKLMKQPVAIVRDNDGDYENKVRQRYKEYDGIQHIQVFADKRDDLQTLEPQFVDANEMNLSTLRKALALKKSEYPDVNAVRGYMLKHKTQWALRVFEFDEDLSFPDYILRAVRWCDG
ncbi:MAG: TOPRIM nucleotidyl transferase/hydrolase domain-containing protein [bacterium]